jgi:hypothetical protein
VCELRPVDYILGVLARHVKECDCGGFCNHAAAVIEVELDRLGVVWPLDTDDEPDPPEYSGGGR